MVLQDTWPDVPDIDKDDLQIDVKKIRYQGEIDQYKAMQAALEARFTAGMANEYTMRQAVQAAYLDAAKAQLDRVQARAQFVQTAAAAIGTAYTGVLALTFAVDKHPLSALGITVTVFLGLSIVLATTYLAYLTPPHSITALPADGTIDGEQVARRNTYIKWIAATVGTRSYWLRSAVISMGCGVGCLPLPYLQIQDGFLTGIVLLLVLAVGVIATFTVPRLLTTQNERDDQSAAGPGAIPGLFLPRR